MYPPLSGKGTSVGTLYAVTHGSTLVEVVDHELLADRAEALLISSNNRLSARSGRAALVAQQGWPGYADECQRLSSVAGPAGVPRGTAVITRGAPDVAAPHHWVLHAVTIAYDHHNHRAFATPDIVYTAVRAGLEKAELFRIGSVATYLMTLREGYHGGSLDQMAEACCQAVLDHAGVARSVRRIAICEPKEEHPHLAHDTLRRLARRLGAS